MKCIPSNKLITPDECIPLLKEQRTHYVNHKKEYGEELGNTLLGIYPFLPTNASNILDIGCGMAGISALLSATYAHRPHITLLDKNGISPTINAGFNASADNFSHYNDFALAKLLLSQNGVDLSNIEVCDISNQLFPNKTYDIVVSLLSWGFHYPISTYTPSVTKGGGVIICDVRKNTDGLDELSKFGDINTIMKAEKYIRVVVKC